ncbi:MAG TPA: winged helix-turn-helix domain-containing protein [Terracidiphilus sp.]|nr:winged helix-turn-helix domain-containing protein [Terracidiphilus sp.]
MSPEKELKKAPGYGIKVEADTAMLELSQNEELSSRNGFHTVRFGEFEVDLQSGEVRKAGSRIKLQDQPFRVLQVLLENPGIVVSREELQSRIWPDVSYGDFDHAVNVAVGKLRTALGDSAESSSFIETVPRRGYRFVAPVEGLPAPSHVPPPSREIASNEGEPRAKKLGPRQLLLVFVAIAACGALLAAGIWLGRHSARSQPVEIQRLTMNRGTIYSARFTPDGKTVIYSASWERAPVELFSTDLKFGGSRALGLTDTDLLAVSSTGEMAVLQQPQPVFMIGMTGTLGQAPPAGGAPRQVAEGIDWADWSPDGKELAVVRNVAGKQRLEFPLGHLLYETSGWISHPRISPDGREIAFLDHPTYDDDEGVVAVIDLEGRRTVLASGWESEEGLAWSTNGKEVWFSATRAGLQRQIYAVDLTGHLRPAFHSVGGVTLQDIAPDGRVLMTRDEHRAGIMGEAQGAAKEQDLSWRDWSLPEDISPDGKTLLFDEQGEQSGPTYIVATRDLHGSPPIALGEGMAGGFSPDGKWVTATVTYSQLLLLPTGAGTVKRIARGDVEHYGPVIHWMPNGKELLFSANQAGHAARCFLQNIDGGEPRPVTPEGVSFCQVSPDGKLIAARDKKEGDVQLYGIDGQAARSVTGLLPGESFAWTSDPRFFYVYQAKRSPIKIFRLTIETGQRQFFKEVTLPDEAGMCGMTHLLFSPDGREYVYGYVQLLSDLYLVSGLK